MVCFDRVTCREVSFKRRPDTRHSDIQHDVAQLTYDTRHKEQSALHALRCAECWILFIIMQNDFMLNVVKLSRGALLKYSIAR